MALCQRDFPRLGLVGNGTKERNLGSAGRGFQSFVPAGQDDKDFERAVTIEGFQGAERLKGLPKIDLTQTWKMF